VCFQKPNSTTGQLNIVIVRFDFVYPPKFTLSSGKNICAVNVYQHEHIRKSDLKAKNSGLSGIFNYTKDFPENTKEKSESLYFEDFYDLIIQKGIEFHMATILSFWRFFWYSYWHIYEWHVSDAMYVNFVINVILND